MMIIGLIVSHRFASYANELTNAMFQDAKMQTGKYMRLLRRAFEYNLKPGKVGSEEEKKVMNKPRAYFWRVDSILMRQQLDWHIDK